MMAIPGWDSTSVADEFHVQLGKRLDAAMKRGEVKACINNRSVRWGHILIEESVWEPLTGQDVRDLRLIAGDVLMCEGGAIGRAAVWSDQLPEAYFLNTLHRLRSRGGYDPYLLTSYFELIAVTGELAAVVGKATLAHLTKENLLKVRLPLPPADEQSRIVAALRSADDLISTLERLLVKKQAIKQGMTQQLLTGRTRLPGFTAPWITAKFDELGTFLKGRGVKRDDVRAIGTPCIRYGELYTVFVNYTASTRSFVDHDVASTALPLRSGDLLFAGSGETRAEIGVCVAYVGDAPAVAGGDIVVLRGNTFNPIFLATLANTPLVANQKSRAGQGDAVVHINSRALAGVTVSLPSRPEQDAIAEVLVDADREIEMLGARLTKAHEIKTGMIQQLLTGRTQLSVEAVS